MEGLGLLPSTRIVKSDGLGQTKPSGQITSLDTVTEVTTGGGGRIGVTSGNVC